MLLLLLKSLLLLLLNIVGLVILKNRWRDLGHELILTFAVRIVLGLWSKVLEIGWYRNCRQVVLRLHVAWRLLVCIVIRNIIGHRGVEGRREIRQIHIACRGMVQLWLRFLRKIYIRQREIIVL